MQKMYLKNDNTPLFYVQKHTKKKYLKRFNDLEIQSLYSIFYNNNFYIY